MPSGHRGIYTSLMEMTQFGLEESSQALIDQG